MPCGSDEPKLSSDRTVSFSELSTHRLKGDCWFNLGCNVFNLGEFQHPGGDIILQICGKTGTSLFLAQHLSWQYIPNEFLSGGNGWGEFIGRARFDDGKTSSASSASFTLEQVAQRNTRSNCWTCISGNMYDLTHFFDSHPGGGHVLEYLCGQDSTLHYLQNHGPLRLSESLLSEGTCPSVDSERAWTEQNLLDGLGVLLYVVVPIVVAMFVLRCGNVRLQDRMLRKPIRKPITSKFLGNMLNSHLEMPLITVALSVWFVGATIVMLGLWASHYDKWYPLINRGFGALGRVTVYLVCLATTLGTRRWSVSWMLFRISYEKTLKAHYSVGSLASIAMLVHGFGYIARYSNDLPGNAIKSGLFLLVAILVVFPAAAFTNLRVAWYSIFKMTHFVAPMIILASIAHIFMMNVDSEPPRGVKTALAWVVVTGGLWIVDSVYNYFDLSLRPATIVKSPHVVADSSGDYITVTLEKRAQVPPGSWMQVGFNNVRTPFGHPFTAIVKTKARDGFSEFQFIWKVNGNNSWTRFVQESLGHMNRSPFIVTGPYGGGLGTLAAMEVIVFVAGGVGVTPAASMIPHLLKTKEVHFIWSCRSRALFQLVVDESFDDETRQYFSANPTRCHITATTTAPSILGEVTVSLQRDSSAFRLQHGRLDVRNIIGKISQDAATKKITDIGVFVCGPKTLVRDVLDASGEKNSNCAYVHVHSESFQL